MSWLTITRAVDVKPVVRELQRLNNLLELIIRLQWDYHVTPVTPLVPDSSEPDSVSYASDADLAKQEQLEEVRRFEAIADDIEKEEA